MSTVKFDPILGRLRESDYDQGGGGETPDPSPHFTVGITPTRNQSYLADAQESPGMTVTVTTRFDGNLVDADSTPDGWTRASLGTYTKTLADPGTVNAQEWSYTPGGIYGSLVAVKNSPARSLSAIYPAYWGLYPSNADTQRDITDIVASVVTQHRVTANLPNTVYDVQNNTAEDCWLWIITKGSATATPEAFDITMLEDPVTGNEFVSPINNSIHLDGYKAYISINKADAGMGFGKIRLSINLS